MINITYELTKNEIKKKINGTKLGVGWLLLNPVIIFILYGFVFRAVFNAKWGGENNDEQYLFMMYIGMITVTSSIDAISKSLVIMKDYSSVLKKTNLDPEVIVNVCFFSNIFHLFISIALYGVAVFLFSDGATLSILLTLYWIVVLLMLNYALIYTFSWMGIFYKDMQQFISPILTGIMFLSPVFWDINSIQGEMKDYLNLNPFVKIIEGLRVGMYTGGTGLAHIDIEYWIVLLLALSKIIFLRIKKSIPDEL